MLRILRMIQRICRIIFKRKRYSTDIDDKCNICKNITAARYMRKESDSVILDEVPDADILLSILPIRSQVGNPQITIKLCKKHHRLIFKAMDRLVEG